MTQWWDDQVAIDGIAATALFDDLDEILLSDWRLACWLQHDAIVDCDAHGQEVWTYHPMWEATPKQGARVIGGWDHDHCSVTFCGRTLGGQPGHERRVGYVTDADEGYPSWLCRQCGVAILKWRETDECKAYMKRRAAGLPGRPQE